MRNLLMLLSALCTASLLLGAPTGCDSSEPEPQDAMLVNRTDSLIGFSVVNKSFLLSLPSPIEFEIAIPSEDGLVRTLAAGNTTELGPCSEESPLADRRVIFWEIEFVENEETGLAIQGGGISNEELLDRLRGNRCRIVVDSLS